MPDPSSDSEGTTGTAGVKGTGGPAAPADFVLALAALREMTPSATIGEPLGSIDEGDGTYTVYFTSLLLGYPGWRWTVSIAHVEGGEPSVLETELTPGDDALLSPAWVPWVDRLADYNAAQEAEKAAAAAAGESSDPAEDESDDDDPDSDDFDDEDDDDDGSPVLHGGDLDGVDIDVIDDELSEDSDEEDDLDPAGSGALDAGGDDDDVEAAGARDPEAD